MRALVEPPPSSHCDLCGGELRFKLIEPVDYIFDLEKHTFVCAICGRECSHVVHHDPHAPHLTTNAPHTTHMPHTKLV
jgi:hypothetical protein